jgi:aspartyl-tRNA(Asn)/glutamyl-tRNA(Gln) amidotransferase subunit A
MGELSQYTIWQLNSLLKNKKLSASELTKYYLQQIDKLDPRIGAYLNITPEIALQQANHADKLVLHEDNTSLLTGIPIGIKDNICTRGIRTSCASKILENFIPPYDAMVINRLKHQGYVLLGKTNMDEFAMGSSTENSGFKLTHNPWDITRVPGGSSGGSAAAVAAGEAVAALGSDTGGSIRQPAACCGVVGLKPTYGLVSRYGLVAFASSLDQIGPITRDVRDAAILLNVIAGHDIYDSTSISKELPDFTAQLGKNTTGLKIGLPKEYFTEGLDEEIRNAIDNARQVLEKKGISFAEVSLPHTEYGIATYYILATAEASSNLARYDGVKYGFRHRDFANLLQMYEKTRENGFGSEVKRRIMLGTYVLSSGYYEAYYLKAQKVRHLIKNDLDRVFSDYDLLLTPTIPTPAFKLGEKIADPLTMYLSDIYTISANLAGIPAISIPCGISSNGLPMGLQLMGPAFAESRILQVAYAFEQETGYHLHSLSNK